MVPVFLVKTEGADVLFTVATVNVEQLFVLLTVDVEGRSLCQRSVVCDQ